MSRYSMSFSRAILTESFHRRSKAVCPNEKCVNSHVSACCSRKTGWTTIQISSYAIFEHVSNALSDTVKEAFSRGRWLTPVTRLWTNAEHRLEQLKKATDRIQKEIEEVTEREHELRNVGSIKTTSHETVDSKVRRMPQALASGKLKRTTSTPQILEAVNLTPSTPTLTPKMTNGVISSRTTPTPLRFATAPSQKGLMHRFLATRGKIYKPKSAGNDALTPPMAPSITLNPLSIKAFNRSLEIQLEPDDEPKKPPVRKGYVPVEEKIQKELHEMKERENELRLMRSQMLAKSQPNLLDIGNDNDSDIYDGSSSLRSGTSTNTLNEDEIEKEAKGKHKPNPRRRSTLIAQWENLIAAKKESNDNNNESDLNF